jgi:hypothetical protein
MSSAALNVSPCRFGEIYLHTAWASFDLHNCFDFVAFTYDVAQRIVTLRWIPNQYTPAAQRRSFIVEMRGVSHVSSSPRDPEVPFSEDVCLSSVGGVSPTGPTFDGAYSEVAEGQHHIFTFQSGFVLRIGAESVCLLPEDI